MQPLKLTKSNRISSTRNLLSFLVIISNVIVIAYCGYSDDTNPYLHTQVLDRQGKYVLNWLADWAEHRIYFNVTVKTRGYIGLGLSRKGLMNGADIVIGGVYPNGMPYFTDRHGKGNQIPEMDQYQNWILHEAWETRTQTFISFSRAFDTCDDEGDLPINEDNVIAVIWAYGERDNVMDYHYQNRGSFNAYLLDPDLTPTEIQEQSYLNVTAPIPNTELGELKIWSIQVDQLMPPQDTTYLCTFYKAPTQKSKQHIVGYRPVFKSDLELRHIHHFLMHRCYPPGGAPSSATFDPFVGQPGRECYINVSPANGIPTPFCIELKHEWAVGAGPIFFPEHVGAPFGESPDEYYMLQVHYDNPMELPNLQLSFTLEVYYTEKLRKYDAGLLYIGQLPNAPSILIPPSETNHIIYGHCGSQCTKKMFPETGIHVFAAKMHTHLAGVATSFLHIHNGVELKPITSDDNYNFNFQPFRILRKERTVYPGDMLVHKCVYDTTDRNGSATVGGYATRNEMCLGFMWYYPNIQSDIYGICYGETRSDAYRNFLQIYNTTWSETRREHIVASPQNNAGSSVAEVGSRIDWTIDKRRELQAHHRFLPQVTGCISLQPDNVIASAQQQLQASLQLNSAQVEAAGAFSNLDKEVLIPGSEFISLWPRNLVPYRKPPRCAKIFYDMDRFSGDRLFYMRYGK